MGSNFISPAMREAMINLIERLDEKDADLLASLFHRIADDNDAMIAEVVRRGALAEREACIQLASDYCWMRYKGRPPAHLHSSAVFTSHEWQKIAEAMRGEREKADARALVKEE